MRFRITRNGEVPIRAQLVRQALLGILSQDLAPGSRLPSVRAMARRHGIHANTVSAAWHDLLDQGWLELRRGSGLYVRAIEAPSLEAAPLTALLRDTLDSAKRLGFAPEEVLRQLSTLVHRQRYERVLIAEPDPAMREILLAELRDALATPVDIFQSPARSGGDLIAALTTRVIRLRRSGAIPEEVPCFTLKLRSVDTALGEPRRIPEGFLIAIVSRSREILDSAHAILIAIGAPPEAVQQVDAGVEGWRERLTLARLIVTDIVMASQLPAHKDARVFRVIADSSIAELKQLGRPPL